MARSWTPSTTSWSACGTAWPARSASTATRRSATAACAGWITARTTWPATATRWPTHVVPLVARLLEARRAEHGWDRLRYWDEALVDPAGNPRPAGDHDFLVAQAQPCSTAWTRGSALLPADARGRLPGPEEPPGQGGRRVLHLVPDRGRAVHLRQLQRHPRRRRRVHPRDGPRLPELGEPRPARHRLSVADHGGGRDQLHGPRVPHPARHRRAGGRGGGGAVPPHAPDHVARLPALRRVRRPLPARGLRQPRRHSGRAPCDVAGAGAALHAVDRLRRPGLPGEGRALAGQAAHLPLAVLLHRLHAGAVLRDAALGALAARLRGRAGRLRGAVRPRRRGAVRRAGALGRPGLPVRAGRPGGGGARGGGGAAGDATTRRNRQAGWWR